MPRGRSRESTPSGRVLKGRDRPPVWRDVVEQVPGVASERLGPKVEPQYPPGAQSDRVKGIVIVAATISPAGCVVSAEVLRGVDFRLDWASLRAVAQWRYTPALVDGVPTQTVMTVTVNFNLN